MKVKDFVYNNPRFGISDLWFENFTDPDTGEIPETMAYGVIVYSSGAVEKKDHLFNKDQLQDAMDCCYDYGVPIRFLNEQIVREDEE